jgi:acetyltransferase
MPELGHMVLPELGEVLVRELRRPEDEEAYLRFGAAMAANDLRMRFAVPTRWSPALAQRMLMLAGTAFAAFGEDGEILGVGRLVENEIALAVHSKLKRRGLGRMLLERIVHSASEHGIAEITGTVLAENRPMLGLAQAAGFRITGSEGPMVSIRLCLP